MISVLILTWNEAVDLPGCLASVAWSDDVHVFDSHSTDGTVAIAEAAGARVSTRAFDDYASQRNAALSGCPFRYPWVLILDADERIPAALAREMVAFVATQPRAVAARIRRRDFLFDTWLRHAQMSPFHIRLVRPEAVWYDRAVNEVLRTRGAIHDLAEPFDHYPFSKGVAHWLDKHNRYSTLEAQELGRARMGETRFSLQRALLSADFNERRFHQKGLFYLLPLRPLIKFIYLFFIRRGFLDGRAGFTYCVLQCFYESMISIKAAELARASAMTGHARPGLGCLGGEARGPAEVHAEVHAEVRARVGTEGGTRHERPHRR